MAEPTAAASPATWAPLVPVATFFLGSLSTLLTEWLRDRRLGTREQLKLQHDRALRATEQRLNLQRETLLALQDAMQDFLRATGEVRHREVMAHRQGAEWGKQLVGHELSEKHRGALVQINKLAVRVLDDELRTMVTRFRDAALEVVTQATSEDHSLALSSEATEQFARANERLGEVLRALY